MGENLSMHFGSWSAGASGSGDDARRDGELANILAWQTTTHLLRLQHEWKESVVRDRRPSSPHEKASSGTGLFGQVSTAQGSNTRAPSNVTSISSGYGAHKLSLLVWQPEVANS